VRYASDRAITQRVNGKDGWRTVHYMVASNAVQALIEVILINGDNENPADIYGTITANNGFGDTELFNRDAKHNIPVRPKDAIPLRTAVAVPMGKTLQVNALVYDHDSDLSPDDEVAKGTVSFDIDIMKSACQSIRGKYGEISVRVSWL